MNWWDIIKTSLHVGGLSIVLGSLTIYIFLNNWYKNNTPNKCKYLPLQVAIPSIFCFIFYCIGMTKTSIIAPVISAVLVLVGVFVTSYYTLIKTDKALNKYFFHSKLPLITVFLIILGAQIGVTEKNFRLKPQSIKANFMSGITPHLEKVKDDIQNSEQRDNYPTLSALYQSATQTQQNELDISLPKIEENFRILLVEVIYGPERLDVFQIKVSLQYLIGQIEQMTKILVDYADKNYYRKVYNMNLLLKEARNCCDNYTSGIISSKKCFLSRLSYQIFGAAALYYSSQNTLLPLQIQSNTPYDKELFKITFNELAGNTVFKRNLSRALDELIKRSKNSTCESKTVKHNKPKTDECDFKYSIQLLKIINILQ